MQIPNYNDALISVFIQQSIKNFASIKNSSILDLGCGSLPYKQYYYQKFDYCIAADYDIRSSDVDCRLSAESLPFQDASFDCVLFSEVIEHIPRYELAIAEISRVLKPGGTLLITWPFLYPMHEVPADFRRFTEFGMQEDLKKYDLEVIALVRRGGAFALLWQMFEFFVIGFLEALCRIRLLGGIIKPVKFFILNIIFRYPIRVFMKNKKLILTLPNEIKGVRGQLAGWTMGYCAVAKRL